MNYLAHLYLSGNDTEILIGNFIADHLKGSLRNNYHGLFLKGIKLHHAIDSFTDSHPVVESSKARLRKHMNKFAPVVADVYYDHFLASNWQNFHHEALEVYATGIYNLLEENKSLLPDRTNYVLHYMRQQNWLTGYAELERLDRIFKNMSARTKYPNNMHQSVEILNKDYDLYKNEFEVFFADLEKMCKSFLLNA